MSEDRKQRLKERIDQVFQRLATVETQLALDWLDACDEGPEVREGVRALLVGSGDPARLASKADIGAIVGEAAEDIDYTGRQIEGLRIIERIGTGGTGDVYLAEDQKLRRKVAVKTIRSSWRFSQQVRNRFRREALILSRLDHPGICRVHNLIETGEADFLVLEYVSGRTLDEWIGEHGSYRRKLLVARRLLDAVSAAHGEQIVHRDLKLRNVMVIEDDQVKVLDFGISRFLMGDSLVKPEDDSARKPDRDVLEAGHTLPGAVLGTLDFISPEQARGEDVSTATDIYALGLIFQSLFGAGPGHPRSLGAEKILERAREGVTDPVSGVPADLAHLIERMKRNAAAARPTAIEALAILDRIIDKPRRRVRWAAAAALILAAGLALLKYTIDLRSEREAAEQARVEAEEVSGFLVDLFEVSDPSKARGEDITARELLDAGATRLENDLASQPQTRARLQGTIGHVYLQLGLYDRAKEMLQTALQAWEPKGNAEDRPLAKVLVNLGGTEVKLRNYEEAEKYLVRAQGMIAGNSLEDRRLSMDVRENLGMVYRRTERFEEGLAVQQGLLQEQLADQEHFADRVPLTYLDMGWVLLNLERPAEAETSMKDGLAFMETEGVDDPWLRGAILTSLAVVLFEAGKSEESIPFALESVEVMEGILEPGHPDLGHVYASVEGAYFGAGQYEEAEKWNARALALFEQAVGTRHLDYADVLCDRAKLKQIRGDLDGSEADLRECISIIDETQGGGGSLRAALRRVSLARTLMLQEKYSEALEQARSAVAAYDARQSMISGAALDAWLTLAEVHKASGHADDAREVLETALGRLQSGADPNQEEISKVEETLAALP